jgi:hypothetical protein
MYESFLIFNEVHFEFNVFFYRASQYISIVKPTWCTFYSILLRIKGLYMFRTLLGHQQKELHKRHLVYCVRVKSVGCTRIGVELALHSNTAAGSGSTLLGMVSESRPCSNCRICTQCLLTMGLKKDRNM